MSKVGKILGVVLIITGLCFVLGFALNKQGEALCNTLDIHVDNQDAVFFLDEDMIQSQISMHGQDLVGMELAAIDLDKIRSQILSNPGVDDAVVTKHLDGRVEISVTQRIPICRVITENGSGFYLDKYGRTVPLSERYTSKVPVFVGHIDNNPEPFRLQPVHSTEAESDAGALKDVFAIADYISNDKFWSAQVDHIYLDDKKDFIIHPRVGNHEIILGSTKNLEAKFEKLKAFYEATINSKDLNQYTAINLKYRDQIVCTKRPW